MYTSAYAAEAYSSGEGAEGPLYLFTPPFVNDEPWYTPTDHGPAVALFRHYRPKSRGVNVFVLSDGNVAQDTGTTENTNTNYPLPWILNDPSGPYSYVTNWDGTITETTLPVWIAYVYEGGHEHIINQTEANFLIAYTANGAGYADCIAAI